MKKVIKKQGSKVDHFNIENVDERDSEEFSSESKDSLEEPGIKLESPEQNLGKSFYNKDFDKSTISPHICQFLNCADESSSLNSQKSKLSNPYSSDDSLDAVATL